MMPFRIAAVIGVVAAVDPDVAKYTNPIMTAASFIPVVGGEVAGSYFTARDVTTCVTGKGCDPVQLAMDASMFIPGGSEEVGALHLAEEGAQAERLTTSAERVATRGEDISNVGKFLDSAERDSKPLIDFTRTPNVTP